MITDKIDQQFRRFGLICDADRDDLLVFKGIASGTETICGPQIVHLDLTNRCNLNCIACWCQSPLLGRDAMPANIRNTTLPLDVITSLVNDFARLGCVKQIKLGGGGEPLLHPNFPDIIRMIKEKLPNAELDINTNFSVVDDALSQLVVDLNVDQLTVSLWAGTAEAYVSTHPNQSHIAFERIVKRLIKIISMRRNGKPIISINNVLMNINVQNVDAMLDLALTIGADEINYVLMDPVPGKTEHLLLTHQNRYDLMKYLKRICKNIDPFDVYTDAKNMKTIRVANSYEFMRRLSRATTEKGMYDKKTVEMIPCYMGWGFTRIMADGKVVPCCKGHRMVMGNLYEKSFHEIWQSAKYSKFRQNGLALKKSHPYFLAMGNNLTDQTGCYNCDNLMHNLVLHRKILYQSSVYKQLRFEILRLLHRWIKV